MELDKKIEELLLEIYAFVPSAGNSPFTIIRVSRSKLIGFPFEPLLHGRTQLVIVMRTDFSDCDLNDYMVNSKEYAALPKHKQGLFLKSFLSKIKNQNERLQWCERITNTGQGILTELARRKKLDLIPIEADLINLDTQFGFHLKSLQAYQLFDIKNVE